MCADPRSGVWRRREPQNRLSDDAARGDQDLPGEPDGDLEEGIPNLIDSQHLESEHHNR